MSRFLNKLEIKSKVSFKNWGNEIVSKTSNVSPWDYILSFLDSLGFMTTVKEGLFSAVDLTEKVEEASYLAQNGINIFEFEFHQSGFIVLTSNSSFPTFLISPNIGASSKIPSFILCFKTF